MGATIGPRFALQGVAPLDWNRTGLLNENQVAFRTQDNTAWVLEVFSRSFREQLLAGNPAWVFLAHIVREDAEQYFAFETPSERALFLEFREIDSVGPKTAAQLLGALDHHHIGDLVHGRSLAGLKIPGVGPKTLDKVAQGVKENRERFLRILGTLGMPVTGENTQKIDDVPFVVVQALEKLGLRREDVVRLCRELSAEDKAAESWEPAEWIRRVLQLWGQRKAKGKIQMSPIEGNS